MSNKGGAVLILLVSFAIGMIWFANETFGTATAEHVWAIRAFLVMLLLRAGLAWHLIRRGVGTYRALLGLDLAIFLAIFLSPLIDSRFGEFTTSLALLPVQIIAFCVGLMGMTKVREIEKKKEQWWLD